MREYTRRQVALIAQLLADELVSTYRNEQVPLMVDNFSRAGFTRDNLTGDEDKLFQMLVTAAYDRRPFSGAAGGYEVIWGIQRRTGSVAEALDRLGLFTLQGVLARGAEALEERLGKKTYHGEPLAQVDDKVEYARTLVQCARLVDTGLRTKLAEAECTEDVASIYKDLTTVHGIGDTIGAKLVKYLLREIGVGNVQPDCFPLSVVWPITQELWVDNAFSKLTARVDVTLPPLVMGVLLENGDPFAIDALFYLQRYREGDFDQLIKDLQSICTDRLPVPAGTRPQEPGKVDRELAQDLLGVIEKILGDAGSVTDAEIKAAGLQGTASAKGIREKAQRMYNTMAGLAEEGNAGGMLQYYNSCLAYEGGQHIGWVLSRLGRKTLESEAERFQDIYKGGGAARASLGTEA